MKTVEFKLSKDNKEILLYYSSPTIAENERMKAYLGIDFDNDGTLRKFISSKELPDNIVSLFPHITPDFEYYFKRIFCLEQKDILEAQSNEERIVFKFIRIKEIKGIRIYYIPGRKLCIENNVFIFQKNDKPILNFNINYFGAGYEKRTSIFKKICEVIDVKKLVLLDDDLIDGNQSIFNGSRFDKNNGYIRFSEFNNLLDKFPTTTVLEHYGDKIIADKIENAFIRKDYNQIFINSKNRILQNKTSLMFNKRPNKSNESNRAFVLAGTKSINSRIKDNLIESFEIIKSALKSEQYAHDESFWQEQVLKILPIIYPQYIGVVREAVIPERYSKDTKITYRKLDHALISTTGNIDLLEVKCPFKKEKLIMKTQYRNNYIPARELSGGILQIQKYIYYIHHLGKKDEEKFSREYKCKIEKETGKELPFSLKFINPRGLLLIGNCEFTSQEQRDFDLIRRQYNNIVDIMTYNDLLKRLERLTLLL